MTDRARSFGAVADAYDRYRPGYPAAALDWALAPLLDRSPATAVLDLGAGTGKLTDAVVGRPGVTVTAVDPDPAMLARLRERLPAVDARIGPAEEIPLPDAAVDAVLVGQAWHWFDQLRAVPEIARVLRPGGVLAVVWNDDDASVGWVDGYHHAMHPEQLPRMGSREADDHPEDPGFEPPTRRQFPHPLPMTAEGLVATVATHSWAQIVGPAERDAALDRLRAYLATCPETASGSFVLPALTTVVRTLRR